MSFCSSWRRKKSLKMVHKMLLELEPEEYQAITEMAKNKGMSRRGLVMSWVRGALEVKPKEAVMKHWTFKLKNGDVLSHAGERPGDAWLALGKSDKEYDLIFEHWESKPMVEVQTPRANGSGDLAFFHE